MTKPTKIFIFGDTHVPFHDPKVLICTLKCLEAFKPDIVVHMGDLFDFYAVSRFDKDPRRKVRLVDELNEAAPVIEEIEAAAGKAHKVFCIGNHEMRLQRFLQSKAPELHGLVTLEDAMDLDDWEFIPYFGVHQIGKVIYTHELKGNGPYFARTALTAAGASVVVGHTHRMGMHIEGAMVKGPRIAMGFGWGGDPKHVDYAHQVTARKDWVHGFGTGLMDKDGSTWFCAHPIIKGKVLFEGKVVTG